MIPSPGGLSEAIKGFAKLAYMSGILGVSKAWGLRHKHCFSQCTMKKCIIDIQLTKGPTIGNSKAENNSDSCGLNDRTESFFIINVWSLMKTFRN